MKKPMNVHLVAELADVDVRTVCRYASGLLVRPRVRTRIEQAIAMMKKPRRRKDPPNTLYVHVAMKGSDRSGDGSAEKPYKTLPGALRGLKGGTTPAVIRLSPGTYTTDKIVHLPRIVRLDVP